MKGALGVLVYFTVHAHLDKRYLGTRDRVANPKAKAGVSSELTGSRAAVRWAAGLAAAARRAAGPAAGGSQAAAGSWTVLRQDEVDLKGT